MEPFRAVPSGSALKTQWEEFAETRLVSGQLDPFVLRSWQRCAPRLNSHSEPRWKKIGEELFTRTLTRSMMLMTIARPVMEDIYQFTESAQAAILLLDNALCALDITGDPALIATLHSYGIEPGVYLTESQTGTTAFSTAQLEGAPSWVVGAEHYLEFFHAYNSSASPIYMPDGSLTGVIGLLERQEPACVQSLGVATSAARAIEAQLQIELFRQEAEDKAVEINHIIDAIADGMLVWDQSGRVIYVNLAGSRILGVRRTHIMGRELGSFMQLPDILRDAQENTHDLSDIECSLTIGEQPVGVVVNLHHMSAGGAALYVMTFRLTQRVRELVSKQVGALAGQTLEDLVGESSATRQVRKQIIAAGKASACVLLEGETGTGRATVARAIHNSGPRRDQPFVAMHCRAIPRELVLAEFLGFEAGAYAHINRGGQPSKFELAHSGTLFLDEIDALPLDMQAALFQVIESGTVLRLGAKHPVPVDVRIIAATTIPLEHAVADGIFRADVYYRLRSFHIRMAPLRERREDIPALVEQKLALMARQVEQPLTLSPRAVEALNTYAWPGNIRELESALERAAAIGESSVIEFEHLPKSVRDGALVPPEDGEDPVPSMAEAERQAIVTAGRVTHGNLSQAALLLGIGRSTLWRKMRTMGLTVKDFTGI